MKKIIMNVHKVILVLFVLCATMIVIACDGLENMHRPEIQKNSITIVRVIDEGDESNVKIEVRVPFIKEVIVKGKPHINLFLSFFDEEELKKKDAIYVRGSHTKTLVFEYFMDSKESEAIKIDMDSIKNIHNMFIPHL